MNGRYYSTRRVVSVVALAMLVLADGFQRVMLNLPGWTRRPKSCCGA